jgi:hypothetical protein
VVVVVAAVVTAAAAVVTAAEAVVTAAESKSETEEEEQYLMFAQADVCEKHIYSIFIILQWHNQMSSSE